ncbi:amidohydrolase family protein [Amycolatopsis sp. GM8]|uniref:amidohydrolase family protein n=1 Tax=Amycolatopsis sp. GM8 TaxID=2896530 RepID=UPI001F3B88F3|nr:amidohydrolase family protein [Amycolatopsis sp. GM8]
MKTLIKGADVITMDPAAGELRDCDILVEDGKIAAVAPDISADAEIVDARGMIAMPGMVDTHRHLWQTPMRGVGVDWLVPDYIRGVRLQFSELYRPEDMYAGNYLGALDALNCGVTTVVDYCHNIVTGDHAHAAVAGLRDAGIRALYGHALTPVTSNGWDESPSDEISAGELDHYQQRLALATEIRDKYFASPDQLLTFGICPQELPIAPMAEIAREVEDSRALGARIVVHANQHCVRQMYADVAHFGHARILGPDMLFVHCSFMSQYEWQLLHDAGASVSICPETEMQMGMGFPAIAEATRFTHGPSIGNDCVIGTGGDLIGMARLTLQVSRWKSADPGYQQWLAPQTMPWTARDAMTWLTVNGAKAAGLEDRVGSLVPGKQADIVLLDMRGISQAGWYRNDPIGAVIGHTNSGNVDTVLVAGSIVKRGGKLIHVDVDAALSTMDKSHEYLYAQAEAHGGVIPQPPVDIPMYRDRA